MVLCPDLKTQTLSPVEMQADFQIFRKALEAKHPEMYRYTSQENFTKLFDETFNSLDAPKTVREFYVTMSPLIVALRCGHTKWLVPGKDQYYPFSEENLFPLELFFLDDKVFVRNSFTSEEVPLNSELISINGENPGQIKEQLFKFLSFGDGYSLGGKYYQLNNFFPGIYSTFYGTKSTYDVEVKADGKVSSYTLKGASLDQIRSFKKSGDSGESPFRFEILDGSTAILDINRFFAYPHEENFKKFLKSVFNEIKSKDINDLVIDLRGNEGGNENWGIRLYRYLALEPFRYYDKITVKKKEKSDIKYKLPMVYKLASIFNRSRNGITEFTLSPGLRTNKPFKDSYRGDAWLLLDGQSFSVATEFASKAKSDKRCIVIGTESSGGYSVNSSGFFTIVSLPNSGIDLGIPLLGFHTDVKEEINPFDRGILPDHQPSHALQTTGKDPDMEYILSLIREKK